MSQESTPSNAPPEDKNEVTTSESRYETLTSYRRPYLETAWDAAELTVPRLLPRNGHSSTTRLPVPFQNAGARGANNLAAKLMLALFPPNMPFFKQTMDEAVLQELEQEHGEESKNVKTEIDKAFRAVEKRVMSDMEVHADRVVLGEALSHLIVTGNALLQDGKDGMKMYRLDQYVTRRDRSGNLLEAIVKESVDPVTLPPHIREKYQNSPKYGGKGDVDLFTHLIRRDTNWEIVQEAVGEKIEKSRGTYPLDACPWIALRFTRIDGEDYGRGYVEDYMGDLISLENLTAAIVQGSAAAAKVLFLVKPNSTTKVKVLAKTPNGGFGTGNAEDVTVLRLDKAQDFQTAKALRDDFIQQLSFAFLLHTAIQRDAERVTAEEIRYMAQELEQVLGGFYSLMGLELQLPLVKVKLAKLQRQGKIPKLPKGASRPVITTGLEALGRGNDRDKLLRYLQTLTAALTPEIVVRYINPAEVAERLAIADGIDTKNLIFTEEQIAQQQQQQQQQALIQQLGPNAINALGGAAKEGIKQNGEQARQQEAE